MSRELVAGLVILAIFSSGAFVVGRTTAKPTWPDTPSELVKTPDSGKIVYTSGDTEESKQPWCFVVRKITLKGKGAEGETSNGSMVFARTCEELALD